MTQRELLKGSASLLVMKLLSERPRYGYEIIKQLDERSRGVFKLREGSLYPILHALESDGCLESFWKPSGGRKRKYYRLTEDGTASLARRTDEWHNYRVAVARVLEGDAT